jgi:hypothetical protein
MTVKPHCRVKDNSCKAGAIAFAKARDAIILPNQLQILYSSTIQELQIARALPHLTVNNKLQRLVSLLVRACMLDWSVEYQELCLMSHSVIANFLLW